MILQVIGELPSYITYPTGPVRYGFPRYVLLWRLRDWRAILYRPILLAAAWDQVKEKHLNPAIVDAISSVSVPATAASRFRGSNFYSFAGFADLWQQKILARWQTTSGRLSFVEQLAQRSGTVCTSLIRAA